ncbi:MAG TPA: UDP-N-acetylmuramate dehydrogenase [Acidimicrobiia bacterium]|jgi:UDP-N-acetylmuramate dehydrogenase
MRGVSPELERCAASLAAALPGLVERDAPLGALTTYRVGGPAAVLVRVQTAGQLEAVAEAVRACRPQVLIVGHGSNLLVADEGFRGVAVLLEDEFEAIDLADADAGTVRAGGAVPLPVLARRTASAGLTGLEFFVGIPGSVGGAVRMNAGGHGRDTREVLRSAEVVDLLGDGTVTARDPAALALGYRESAIGSGEVVVAATFAVDRDDPAACEARVAEIVRWRREHQPGGSNAGSVFRNPDGDAAGRLVEACGLKGRRHGCAVVSEKHANFIQADAGATAADVDALIREVQAVVAARTGVELVPEVHRVGFEDVS